jgi:alpha-beta hydrolase superfamily lysophospholipase
MCPHRPSHTEAGADVNDRTLIDADGVEIFYRAWPQPRARGVVVIAHGASEHSGRYDRFAHALADAGFASYALDHRGHGRTAAATGPGRIGPGGGGRLVDDLDTLVDLGRAEHPDVPVILIGHSMGSLIAQAYVTRCGDRLAGYVLSGCPGVLPAAEQLRAAMHGAVDAGMADESLDSLGPFNEPFEPARTKFDWLSRDPDEVDRYVADPLCGDDMPLTYGYMDELLALTIDAMEPSAIATIPPMPVLMITGERDPASGMAANARELEGRLRSAGLDVTAHYYPDARHELLNETNRDEVTADIVRWLDGVAPAQH